MVRQQHTCEIDQLLKTLDALIQLSQASFDYQLVLADIWVKAFLELARELAFYQAKGEKIDNLRQFLEVWSSIFDREFAQKFRSEDAQAIQGKFLKVAMSYWLEQQQLLEGVPKMVELPSCNQVDESKV
ncbi:MAG TPA: poly(R)-hydroxyalkanoic acid synthase subunit PhaE [Nostoc sp.]|uniref:poly(R)-hydroxyalkanoic acid synthase subunit PhaE n=1 Tax=Nostoc sp. TaxID=1180 RepID=UPI002D509EDC|nr:poly(R)-hydroxyalkanoic acid synthase subunit PhaE [Nostoc sp.]HYX14310.1 poly(R)-hydroxyalkanoic acid synthase subunit PhaE [Nostoc sp.]